MSDHPSSIKEKLVSFVLEMSLSVALFVKRPGKDFTRERKLPFATVVMLLISMGGHTIYSELLERFGLDKDVATTSAFVQQRDKILPFAFEFLLHESAQSCACAKQYMGYRLLAFDGSDLPIATDPDDPETYYETRPDRKGYNLMHLNAMFDLQNKFYLDICVQPGALQNENKALCDMVDRSRLGGKTIVLADRGFESYNNFMHIENKGWNYVIRVKDTDSRCGIASGLRLPKGGVFDAHVSLTLTNKQTNDIKAQPDVYKYICSKSTFDFLDSHTHFCPISFRVVRIRLGANSYETVITNLDALDFPPNVIKKLYHMRWGIETSFRELKYTVGLSNFHARKREYIVQEIYARTILYNFAEMIASHVVIAHADTKFAYQVNFSAAVDICRRFLRLQNNVPTPDVEALIRRNILPIRLYRSFVRKLRNQTAVGFIYRVA